jgi:hypothetical protein
MTDGENGERTADRGKKQGRNEGWKMKWRKSGDEREGTGERE